MDLAQVSKKIIAFGSKQVFLPKFTIALVRTPHLSPYHARFLVPLNFSKYDLRDYLYHAYQIKVHNIRSYVNQSPVRWAMHTKRHLFREESQKYMTVEMEKPFVWPEEPENWSQWGKKKDDPTTRSKPTIYTESTKVSDKRNEAAVLREQAAKILGHRKSAERKEAQEQSNKSLLKLWKEKRTPSWIGRKEAA